jgi:hypothetical protein
LVQDNMRLSNRTQSGLEVLLKSTSITTTMKAISSLEVASRWSDVCAGCIADLGAVSKLYLVLQSCNRSKPHIELAKMCLKTIANFTGFRDRFRKEVSILPLAAEALSEVIQSMRDTDEEIVMRAIGLLSYIAQDREAAMQISQLAGADGQPSPVQRLNLTMVSLKRKGTAPTAAGARRQAAGPTPATELSALLRRVG